MYLPTHFEETRLPVLHALMRSHPLGLLVTQNATALEANPIPFVVDSERGPNGTLRGHVARANPLWREARGDVDALVVFQGPQAYVSPSWYASKADSGKVVPTWNYILVQVRGRLKVHDDVAWLRQLVGELTERHEAPQAAPWQVAATMLKAIVGIEIEIGSLNGKWKVSQNRPAADRDGVVRGLSTRPGSDAAAMAQQVRQPGAPMPPSAE
jgi:transcriptional regulator